MPDCSGENAEIRFRHPDEEPYGPLSNYYPCAIEIDGAAYRSVEHAYQAMKAARGPVADWIAAAPDGFLAAMAGDSLPGHEIAEGWEGRRAAIMRPLLEAKFTQHPHLRALLIATADAELAEWASEDTETNRFWSKVGGHGENVLGRLLMELRAKLARGEGGLNPRSCGAASTNPNQMETDVKDLSSFLDLAYIDIGAFSPKPTCIEGDQMEAARTLYRSEDGTVEIGIWECTPGRFTADRSLSSETCHFISGRIEMRRADGEVTLLGPGDLLVLPQGWKGEWRVLETTRKLYVVHAPKPE